LLGNYEVPGPEGQNSTKIVLDGEVDQIGVGVKPNVSII